MTSTALSGRLATPAAAQDLSSDPHGDALARDTHAAPDRAAAAATLTFSIAPGPLEDVIVQFERITGLKVLTPDASVRTVQSPGVTGQHTPEQALQRLLASTGVVARFNDTKTVVFELRVTADDVTVTGQVRTVSSPKFTEPLRDVPQTITVIPKAVIEAQGASTLRDVLRNVSGITFQAGEGGTPAGDQLTIRGFSARTDMFIDGVRDFGGYSRDAFNMEQVEVSKGPSSSIAGRGSTGGAINQVSKAPTLGRAYNLSVGGGNADYKRTTLDVNQPLDSLGIAGAAFRVNAMWTDTGTPGRDEVKSERWGIAPSLAFGLGSPTRFTVSYLHLGQDNLPEYGIPWVGANTSPVLEAYANGQPPVDQRNFYGLKSRDYEKTDTDVATAQVDHDFSGTLSLRNITRYGRNVRDSVIAAPRFVAINTSTAITRQLQSRDMTDTVAANQTNLTARVATGRLQHAFAAGLEFSQETSKNFARTGPAAPTTDLFAPDPNQPYTGPIVRTGAYTDGTANSAAAYLFDTVKLAEQWEVTGGLRWDRFDADYDTVTVAAEKTNFQRTDNMVSWRAGVVYKPKPNGSVYVGYGTSFNPSAEGLSLSASTVELKPEQSRNYEVGTKWDVLQEKLSLTSAVFRTEKTNARTPGVNPGDPLTVLTGEQVVQGLELGLQGRLNASWTALASYSFMHSDIPQSNTPADLDNALALTPQHTLNLWTTYLLPVNITVGGGLQYMDSVFRNTANTAEVPSYWLVNAMASYTVNPFLTFRLNATNLANERYVDRVGGGHYIPGPGRQVMLSADVKLGR